MRMDPLRISTIRMSSVLQCGESVCEQLQHTHDNDTSSCEWESIFQLDDFSLSATSEGGDGVRWSLSCTTRRKGDDLKCVAATPRRRRLRFRCELFDCDWDGNALSDETVCHYAKNKRRNFQSLEGVFVIGEALFFFSSSTTSCSGASMLQRPTGLIFVAYTVVDAQPPPAQVPALLKYLSFNIWVGGGLSLQTSVDIMRSSQADIIALQEATPLTVEIVANALGFAGFDVEVAVMSRLVTTSSSLPALVPPHHHASNGVMTTTTRSLVGTMHRDTANSVVLHCAYSTTSVAGVCSNRQQQQQPQQQHQRQPHHQQEQEGRCCVLVRVSNIHLPAYPYPPYVLIEKGVSAALTSEAALQLPHLEKLFLENRLYGYTSTKGKELSESADDDDDEEEETTSTTPTTTTSPNGVTPDPSSSSSPSSADSYFGSPFGFMPLSSSGSYCNVSDLSSPVVAGSPLFPGSRSSGSGVGTSPCFPTTGSREPLRVVQEQTSSEHSSTIGVVAEEEAVPVMVTRQLDIVSGDFNCPSHLDHLWHKSFNNTNMGRPVHVPWSTSQLCQRHGFIDTFRHCNPEQPDIRDDDQRRAHSFYSWSPMEGRERRGCYDRIDFVYARLVDASTGITQRDADVVHDCVHLDSTPTGAVWPSDHRAVLATLNTAAAL